MATVRLSGDPGSAGDIASGAPAAVVGAASRSGWKRRSLPRRSAAGWSWGVRAVACWRPRLTRRGALDAGLTGRRA